MQLMVDSDPSAGTGVEVDVKTTLHPAAKVRIRFDQPSRHVRIERPRASRPGQFQTLRDQATTVYMPKN